MSLRDAHVTDSVHAARDDARAQAGLLVDAMPYVPASSSPFAPDGVDPESLVWAETVRGGGYSHRLLARGSRVRLTDVTGDACANVLLFNALEPWDRLNVADTQTISGRAYLGAGQPLLSGDGRALATITGDESGKHDAFCGTSTAAFAEHRYGASAPESASPAGRELFLLAGSKHGLAARDLPPSISFFQGVEVGADGSFDFTGSAGPDRSVELLIELPVIMLIANVPHPLDPRDEYTAGPLRVHAWRDRATEPGDELWAVTPESHRAYLNTTEYLRARGAL